MDALALNGKHYRALFKASRGGEAPYLTFPGWGSKFDHRDDLSECCLAKLGTYSTADGLDLDANDFLAANFAPVSRALGDIVLPDNKYYSRTKIASLADKSKIDVLVGDATSLLHYHGVFIAATDKSPARIHFPHWKDSYDTKTDVLDMCLSNRGEYSTRDGIIEATNNLPRSRSATGIAHIYYKLESHMNSLYVATPKQKSNSKAKPIKRKTRKENQVYTSSDLNPPFSNKYRKDGRGRREAVEEFHSFEPVSSQRRMVHGLISSESSEDSPHADTPCSSNSASFLSSAGDNTSERNVIKEIRTNYVEPLSRRNDPRVIQAETPTYKAELAVHKPGEHSSVAAPPSPHTTSLLEKIPGLVCDIERQTNELLDLRTVVRNFEVGLNELKVSCSGVFKNQSTCKNRVSSFTASVAASTGPISDDNAVLSIAVPALTARDLDTLQMRMESDVSDLKLLINVKLQELTVAEHQLIATKAKLRRI